MGARLQKHSETTGLVNHATTVIDARNRLRYVRTSVAGVRPTTLLPVSHECQRTVPAGMHAERRWGASYDSSVMEFMVSLVFCRSNEEGGRGGGPHSVFAEGTFGTACMVRGRSQQSPIIVKTIPSHVVVANSQIQQVLSTLVRTDTTAAQGPVVGAIGEAKMVKKQRDLIPSAEF